MGSCLQHMVVVVVVAGVVSGCTQSPEVSSTMSPTVAPPLPSSSSSSSSGLVLPRDSVPEGMLNEFGLPIENERPDFPEVSAQVVEERAQEVMIAFADRESSTWFARLQPLLTYDAAVVYAVTDPLNVPIMKVGSAKFIPETPQSNRFALVEVSTSVGPYLVSLMCENDLVWRALALNPVGGDL